MNENKTEKQRKPRSQKIERKPKSKIAKGNVESQKTQQVFK